MFLLVAAAGCRRAPPGPTVTINGRSWSVELAVTDEQRYRGMSGRKSVDEDSGMLFVFPRQEMVSFCMRGCLVPLDVAFIDENMRVVKIHTMAVEPDLAGKVTYSSETPARYALEIAGGALARAAVRVGQRVVFSHKPPGAPKAWPIP